MLAGGLAAAVHAGTVFELQHGNIFGFGLEIIQAAGADGHQALFLVGDADVAARALGQASGNELLAVFNDEFAFLLHQHGGFLLSLL